MSAPVALRRTSLTLLAAVGLFGSAAFLFAADQPAKRPPVVTPGEQALPVAPPSDAIVLFDGKNLDQWTNRDGKEPAWTIADGVLTVKPGGKDIVTKDQFGDFQLHLEFASPKEVKGKDQGRGNSGLYLHGRYEVQILDSFENETYPNGQCGAVYGQSIPLVNVCRGPGQWQSYDIIFRAPRLDESGKLLSKPTVTVLHNNVLIQNNFEIQGPTTLAIKNDLPATGPILLQDHGCLVQYRNIWIRKLEAAK